MKVVKHWKRSGFKCEHTANSIEGALIECLRCRGLSTSGASMLTLLLEKHGEATFVVGEETFFFRTVRRR